MGGKGHSFVQENKPEITSATILNWNDGACKPLLEQFALVEMEIAAHLTNPSTWIA